MSSFSLVEESGVALNIATLVGLGTTRQAVCGDSERRLDHAELDAQARIVREACEQGALGVSSGLIYPPSMYADVDELSAMALAAKDANAPLYASHVRDEAENAAAAIEEALEVGRLAQVTVQCSHHKASGKSNWGKVHQTLALIDAARTRRAQCILRRLSVHRELDGTSVDFTGAVALRQRAGDARPARRSARIRCNSALSADEA